MNTTTADQTDKTLIKLFDQLHELKSQPVSPDQQAGIHDVQSRILALLEQVFRSEIAPKLARQLGSSEAMSGERSMQYSELSQRFYESVLEDRDDPFWKARTLRALINYTSIAMRHIYIDHYRKSRGTRRRGQVRSIAVGSAIDVETLVQASRAHFESSNAMDYGDALEQIERWSNSDEERERRWSAVLTHRYVDGLSCDEISSILDLTRPQLYKLAEKAKAALRRELTDGERGNA